MDRTTKPTKAEQALYDAVVAAVTGTLYAARVHREKQQATAHIAHEAGMHAVRELRQSKRSSHV
jgi:hypothetical protein